MRVVFVQNPAGPERLLAEAEIHFSDESPLRGMKLVGFSIWRGQEGDLFVTFPARSFGVSGERRFFDLLRAVEPGSAEPKSVKDWILQEWERAHMAPAESK